MTYEHLRKHRRAFFCALFALLACCVWFFLTTPIRSDIRALLPEGDNGQLIQDFDMLAQSGLANNVFITVRGRPETDRLDLIAAADTLATALKPPLFRLIDPASVKPLEALRFLLDNAPNLVNEAEMVAIGEHVAPQAINARLRDNIRQLSSPQGIVMKRLIRRDPLGFTAILAPRLKALNIFSAATLADGHLFSKDNTAILLSAHSDIPLTDAEGASRLLSAFESASADLAPGITAEIISGHVHTLGNATTIKSDLIVIAFADFAALALLFFVFFAQWTL